MKANLATNQERADIGNAVVQAVEDLNQIINNINGANTTQIKQAIAVLAQHQKKIIKRLVQLR